MIAPAARLSPAGLLKRFGSRQGILVALSRKWIDSIPDSPDGQTTPGSELRRWVEQRFSPDGPERVAQGLALLGQARLPRLSDPNRGACLLFDALNGAMLRHATEPTAPSPAQTLDDPMETWT